MATDHYLTVDAPGEASYRVKGSRFIGYIAPATTIDAAETFIAEVGSEHPDATHVVPAYRIRADPLREYQNDAGEPGGSAGPPMLNVLQGEDLENVVAVVVRYYGGTQLGIGGLVRAYGDAVKRAIRQTVVIERRPQLHLTVEIEYDDSGTVRSILEGSEARFDAAYGAEVAFDIQVPIEAAAELRERILSATSGRARIAES